MEVRRTALVIGGSLGGLFAANLLLRAGWDVDVYERVGAELAGRGAGIVTHEDLFDAIERAGGSIDETIGCSTHSRVTIERAGHVVAEMPSYQILTAWGRLYRLLKDVFPARRYHFNKSLARIEQDADTVIAHFSDGTHAAAELLIGADGIRSTVRELVLPQAKPVYAGYVAWRGLADESAVSADTRRVLLDRMGFCLPPGEQMLTYLIAGRDNTTRVGERRFNFVWYRPADEKSELPALFTDADGHCHEHSIPPNRIRSQVIAAMHAAAERQLAPPFADIVRAAAEPFFQPIYDLESSRIVRGRVALLGDAAFVARPHVGLGVTKAAGDAVALIDAIEQSSTNLNAALGQYQESRVKFGSAIVAHARLLGLGIGPAAPTGPQAALVNYLRQPQVVMRETAVPDWADRASAMRHLQVT